MEENEKTASEIARGIHPNGYGAIMSFTGTREFTARVNGLSFRFTKGTDLNHVSVHRNGGQGYTVEFSMMDRNGVKATTQRHQNVPTRGLRELFEKETGIRMPAQA